MRNLLPTLALMLLGACTISTHGVALPPDSASLDPVPPEAAKVPYNEAIQTSAHNAFEREEPLLDQLIYDRVRSLELDIHSRKEGVDAPADDWFVYHEDLPLNRSTSCNLLSDCARLLGAFHTAVPQHEVVTLWLDLKADFVGTHDAQHLDDAVAQLLGRENVVTPADLMKRCPTATTLRSAVTGSCSFPTLEELRGKFIVAVTGGNLCNSSDLVSVYGGDTPRDRLMFLAPGVDGSCPVSSYDAHPDVVMFNMVFGEHERAADVRSRGLIARVYRGLFSLNNAPDFLAAQAVGTNHIAMDMLNVLQDPWASTQSTNGFPFACDGCAPPVGEPAAIIGVEAKSGDLAGNEDSFYFASISQSADQNWTTMISVPSSHVEPLAKGCLMARESDDPGAAFFAICRPFDQKAPLALTRSVKGGAVAVTEAPTVAGFRPETAAFVRLTIRNTGVGSEAVASTSIDGLLWSELARMSFDVALPHRGLAVAGKSSGNVKALFLNVTNSDGPLSASQLPDRRAIGFNAEGRIYDGVNRP